MWPRLPAQQNPTRRGHAHRAFPGRAVRYLAADAGMRQFLDIGTGIPTSGNTHEIVQAIAPQSRVVYVDYHRRKSGCAQTRWTGQAV
jgi:S-adenosyl methyltransferase